MLNEPLNAKRKESFSSQFFTQQFIAKLLQLEGQCKIRQVMYLKFNPVKSVFLMTLLTISIIGLFLLKYFKKLRAKVFYSQITEREINDITHIYAKGYGAQQQICQVTKLIYADSERVVFEFKKLKYEIYENKTLPLGFPFIDRIGELRKEPFTNEGLSFQYVAKRQEFYGKNQHRVEVPGYFEFLFDTMTQPFFVFQYLVSIIYILENSTLFGILMIVFGFITTSVNYVLLNRSYNKIKETAQKLFKVNVLRNGSFKQIDNIDIVPGDLYQPTDEIPCDSIVVKGELFVDQVNLTGENVPIAKSKIISNSKHSDKSHWLFEGSKVQTMKENTLALAVNVGYASQRGRIIRKILNKSSKQPQFFMKLIYFQVEVMIISFIIYFLSLPQLLTLEIDTIMIIFRFFDFVTYSFPAPFPIFFNLAYSFCLVRLNNQNIIGTQTQKTVESSRMKTICFDKTGTLTLNKMEISNVYSFEQKQTEQITNKMREDVLISSLFATCNSVQLINGEIKGDEIDLRMFQLIESRLGPSQRANVVRQVKFYNQTVQVIKINQYQSQFQSMSVLVRDAQTKRCYVFVKGSPQMIHHYSVRKINGFQKLIKNLSFSGFRSIGFGYKEIQQKQLQYYFLKSRQEYLQNTNILGVVTFVNQLKTDAKSTISMLAECQINTKIITGDNIFLGVQTAMMIGMIPEHCKITVLEGKKYSKETNSIQVLHLIKNENGSIQEHSEKIGRFRYEDDQNHFYAIDNDFIKQNPQGFLHDKVKVFARTSPENKALIVRKHKERILQQEASLTKIQKALKDCSYKVGMVGDGANDLIAIKQAHVGIGISSSDAVFSASFAIKQLSQILEIIKQSKNTQRQIVEMARYYGLTQFTSIIVTLILSTDASYFTSLQLIYKAFMSTLVITVFIGMSKPSKKMSKYLNNSNFIDLENHLGYWLTMIIYSIGLIGAYLYFFNSGDFIANTNTSIRFPEGWFGKTQSCTINFITSNIEYTFLPFAIYRSQPWKLPIWTNKPVTILIIVNIVVIFFISFFNDYFGFLAIQQINSKDMIVMWIIMLVTSLIAIITNILIQKFFFSKMKQQLESNSNQYKEKQLKGEN